MKAHQKNGQPTGGRLRLVAAYPRQPDTKAAWSSFEGGLAEALDLLEEDEYLVIASKRRNHYVQFACQGHHGMRIEAVSNAYITVPADRLTDAQHEHLAALGWDGPQEMAPGRQTAPGAGTQGNFFLDVAVPVQTGQVAELACATLRSAYNVRHPGELAYRAFRSTGRVEIRFPSLRLRRIERNDEVK